jgi:hypothetical protein
MANLCSEMPLKRCWSECINKGNLWALLTENGTINLEMLERKMGNAHFGHFTICQLF